MDVSRKKSNAEVSLLHGMDPAGSQFLNSILDSMPVLIASINPDLRYQFINLAFENWFGVSRQDWAGLPISDPAGKALFDLYHPDLEIAFLGKAVHREAELLDRKGQSHFVQISLNPDFSESLQVRSVTVLIQDISEQVRSRENIRRKEKELARILNSVPAFIGYFDQDEVNINSNQAYALFFGKTPSEIRGLKLDQLQNPDLYQKNRPFIQKALQGLTTTFEREITHLDGHKTQVLAQYIPDIVDEKVEGFFIVVTDISELKKLEGERRSLETKMIASAKMSLLGEMAGGVAHEINNPLAIIGGTAALLRKSFLDQKVNPERAIKSLDKIESTVERIAKIVRGLKVFARDAEKDLKVQTDLGAVIDETLELCRERLKVHGIAIRCSIQSHDLALCNPTQISQVLMNLISNSVDAVQALPEKWIEIQLDSSSDQRIQITVTDSGPGIPLEIADKILNPFFTTKPVGQGTGLGLSISKGLAEDNQGTLTYIPQALNTCFALDLPKQKKIES